MTHDHHHAAPTAAAEPSAPLPAQEYWEGFYGERDQVWSGRANALMVREVEGLTPGTALDLGCAEGGDAVWLAQQGWLVTAVDVSDTALRRAAVHAEDAGVAASIEWQRHDLGETFPSGTWDLVSAAFFHSPPEAVLDRTTVLRRAADAVAPGGTLLVVGHASGPSWMGPHPMFDLLPSTTQLLADLALDQAVWTVELEDLVTTDFPSPEGEHGTRADNVLQLRRAA
ncbi:class I SAM-dependent methyltransferase [Solicola sp. PLA-1-18]|uniref:class I SAM-dependent methyltransferase n=1 Tax=Solicola sp. PLA-1-18 TaxID=3380532 RepID=UPI003B75E7B4